MTKYTSLLVVLMNGGVFLSVVVIQIILKYFYTDELNGEFASFMSLVAVLAVFFEFGQIYRLPKALTDLRGSSNYKSIFSKQFSISLLVIVAFLGIAGITDLILGEVDYSLLGIYVFTRVYGSYHNTYFNSIGKPIEGKYFLLLSYLFILVFLVIYISIGFELSWTELRFFIGISSLLLLFYFLYKYIEFHNLSPNVFNFRNHLGNYSVNLLLILLMKAPVLSLYYSGHVVLAGDLAIVVGLGAVINIFSQSIIQRFLKDIVTELNSFSWNYYLLHKEIILKTIKFTIPVTVVLLSVFYYVFYVLDFLRMSFPFSVATIVVVGSFINASLGPTGYYMVYRKMKVFTIILITSILSLLLSVILLKDPLVIIYLAVLIGFSWNLISIILIRNEIYSNRA